jgi:hypothetical protein
VSLSISPIPIYLDISIFCISFALRIFVKTLYKSKFGPGGMFANEVAKSNSGKAVITLIRKVRSKIQHAALFTMPVCLRYSTGTVHCTVNKLYCTCCYPNRLLCCTGTGVCPYSVLYLLGDLRFFLEVTVHV